MDNVSQGALFIEIIEFVRMFWWVPVVLLVSAWALIKAEKVKNDDNEK